MQFLNYLWKFHEIDDTKIIKYFLNNEGGYVMNKNVQGLWENSKIMPVLCNIDINNSVGACSAKKPDKTDIYWDLYRIHIFVFWPLYEYLYLI